MKNPIEELRQMEVPVTEEEWASIVSDKRYVQKFGRQPKMSPKGRAALIAGIAAALIAVPILVKTLSHSNTADPVPAVTTTTESPVTQATAIPSESPATITEVPQKASNPVSVSTPASEPSVVEATAQAANHESATLAAVTEKRQPTPITMTAASEKVPEPTVKPATPEKSSTVATTEKPTKPQKSNKQKTDNAKSNITVPFEEDMSQKFPESEPETEEADQFFIPTAFTPNGDGLNDLFYVKANFEPRNFEMTIISRNGDRVFQTRDMNIGWDGKLRDKTLPQGMYVYIIHYKDRHGDEQQKQGQILLIP